MSYGRLFHVLAATTDISSKDGSARRVFVDDRNVLVGT